MILPGGSTNTTDMFPAIPFTLQMREEYCAKTWGLGKSRLSWVSTEFWGTGTSSPSFPAAVCSSLLCAVPCFVQFPAFCSSLLCAVPCFLQFPAFCSSLLSAVPCSLQFPAFCSSWLSVVIQQDSMLQDWCMFLLCFCCS